MKREAETREPFSGEELAGIRSQFPILKEQVNGQALVYLDNAATTQKPQVVIDAVVDFYRRSNANIHRGVHTLSQRATDQYEAVRQTVARFINSATAEEIIMTSGTTAGLNMLARGLVEPRLKPGDQVLVTVLEHHSNLIPWQEVCRRTGAELVYVPLTEDLTVDLAALESASFSQVKVLAIQHVSNVLGIEQPIKALAQWAKAQSPEALVIVDGAQAVQHQVVDVTDLGVDAYCFSGHKLYAPSGTGICYLNRKWHQEMAPVNYGGGMIHHVGDFHSTYQSVPTGLEAGTPPIEAMIGLGTAIRYVEELGLDRIQQHEEQLTRHLLQRLSDLEGVQLYHPLGQRQFNGMVSFNLEGIHPHDAATGYDMAGIALRAGHHCAQPLMRYLKAPATLRASLSFYNTLQEVDAMVETTQLVKEFFSDGII